MIQDSVIEGKINEPGNCNVKADGSARIIGTRESKCLYFKGLKNVKNMEAKEGVFVRVF